MTDLELLSSVLGTLDPGASPMSGLHRNGRLLLGIPAHHEAATRALGLYQPQRLAARALTAALRLLARWGLHSWLMPRQAVRYKLSASTPPLPSIDPGTCGVLLGSPEHQVKRAIASYRTDGEWEVAKIAIGGDGERNLVTEAQALDEIHPLAEGVPRMLGLHRCGDLTVLRMPYLTGDAVPPGMHEEAVRLLVSWIQSGEPRHAVRFPEWESIGNALSAVHAPEALIRSLFGVALRGVICHGDFARWNLRKQRDGKLIVLDWEWGHRDGMPGIDLVHYFLQDMRLVRRMPPEEAIQAALRELRRPECAAYLTKTGWADDPLRPVIACLAYKQGAGHQENREILGHACRMAKH